MRVLLVAGLGWFLAVGAFAWMLCRAAALGDRDLEGEDCTTAPDAATAGADRPLLVAVGGGGAEELAVVD